MKHCGAIILAAGSGKRMNSSVPKQFMEIGGEPLFLYSIRAFAPFVQEIVLVTGKEYVPLCEKILAEKVPEIYCRVTVGGKERWNSSAEGLKYAGEWEYVMIHDAARACVDAEVIKNSLESAEKFGSGIAAVPAKDTIRIVGEDEFVVSTPRRDTLRIIQTPQTFRTSLILDAYEKLSCSEKEQLFITDDAMVLETFGKTGVHLSRGNYSNIKITTPEDLVWAGQYLKTAAHS